MPEMVRGLPEAVKVSTCAGRKRTNLIAMSEATNSTAADANAQERSRQQRARKPCLLWRASNAISWKMQRGTCGHPSTCCDGNLLLA